MCDKYLSLHILHKFVFYFYAKYVAIYAQLFKYVHQFVNNFETEMSQGLMANDTTISTLIVLDKIPVLYTVGL